MAVNGTTLTTAELNRLAGPSVSTPYDLYDRLFASYDAGKVFSYGDGDARDMRQMLRQDGNARKVEQVLTLPLRSAAWEIRAAPGDTGEAAYIHAQFDTKLDKIIDQMTTAIVYRKAFFELTYSVNNDGVNVDAVDWRPPATCEAAYDPQTGRPLGFRQRVGNPGGLITIQANQSVRGDQPGYVTVGDTRAFVYVHGAYREPIEGLSDLDVAYWVWQTRQKIYFLWFQFLEQQSLPKILAYGDDPTQADANRDAIADAGASGVLGIQRPNDPTAKTFDILASDGSGAGQFVEAIRYLEGLMSASVLASFTDLGALASHSRSQGSYALSADQSEFFLSARQAVADEMAEAVTRDLFKRLCVWQFGADCKPPSLEIGPLSKHDKERALRVLDALLTAQHFNAPPPYVDLLLTSTAGYLGLPVDQVGNLVEAHPTQDPTVVKEQMAAALQKNTPPHVPPPVSPLPPTPVGQGVGSPGSVQ